MAYGMLGNAQVAVQNSYGTSNVASLYAFPIISETLEYTIDQLQEAGMYARFGESPRHKGVQGVQGQLVFEPQPTMLGLMLYLVCGSRATTFATSIATHVFNPRNTSDWDEKVALPAATILLNRDANSAMAYFDVCATQLQLEIEQGALMRGTVDFVGGNYAHVAKSAPVFPTERPIAWNQFSATFAGAGIGNWRSCTITINNQLEPVYLLGDSGTPSRIARTGPVMIAGEGVLLFQSNSLMDTFRNQTEQRLVWNFTSDVASPCQLTIDVPAARITTYRPVINGAGLIELPVSFVGQFSVASNNAVRLALVNSTAQYP